MTSVFLLWHTHRLHDGEDDEKLIGVYETRATARLARKRVGGRPGFAKHPRGFRIAEFKIGSDNWTEGFITVSPRKQMMMPNNYRIRRLPQARLLLVQESRHP